MGLPGLVRLGRLRVLPPGRCWCRMIRDGSRGLVLSLSPNLNLNRSPNLSRSLSRSYRSHLLPTMWHGLHGRSPSRFGVWV